MSLAPWLVGASGCRPQGPNGAGPGEEEVFLKGIEGEIVGPSMEAGHLLRTSGGLEREPSSVRELDVLVVGGGIAGLTAGWRLIRNGFRDFELLELESEVGGKSRSGRSSVSAYPWGAHYLPVPTRESVIVRQILDEMGLVIDHDSEGEPIYDPRHLCHSLQERLFVGNRWQPGLSLRSVTEPQDAAEVDAFETRLRELRDFRDEQGKRAFALPMELSSREPSMLALDGMSMADYLNAEGWTSPRLRWYLDYCCRDDYGCSLEDTSAWAGWHYFCARPESAEVLTWPEGNGRLVDFLRHSIGDRLQTGSLVCRVRPASEQDDRLSVDVLNLQTQKTIRYRCRRLIYALPRFTAPYVVEGFGRELSQGFTYAPWLVANLTVDLEQAPMDGRSFLSRETAWDNVFYGSRSLGYVVSTHQNLSSFPGPTVLTYYLPFVDLDPVAARTRLQAATWPELARSVLGDLAQAHPDIVDRVDRIDLMRWGHAMIRPTPGFIWGSDRQPAALDEKFPGIFFAHSDMSGLSLFEEASFRGAEAADQLLASLG